MSVPGEAAVGAARVPVRAGDEIRSLTGLRAVAALWVVLGHVAFLSGPYLDQLPVLRPLVESGWAGVELFFVLSGFVIAHNYLDTLGARWRMQAAVRFVVKRFARVWPVYAVLTLAGMGWLVVVERLGWDADIVTPMPDVSAGALVQQLSMTQMWGASTLVGQSYDPPGWSISVEWLAYLVFPVLALVLRPVTRLPAVVLVGASSLVMVPLFLVAYRHGSAGVDVSWVLRISCCFVSGALASAATRRLRQHTRAEQWGLVLCVTAVAGAVVLVLWAGWRATSEPGSYYGVCSITFPFLVVGLALTRRGPARWLSAGPLVYGGRISYSLYLVHFLVLNALVTWYWQDTARRGVVTPALALAAPLVVLTSVGLAALVHRVVEEPSRRALLGMLDRAPARRARPAHGPVPAPAARAADGVADETVVIVLPRETVGPRA